VSEPAQTTGSVEANKSFFAENEKYAEHIAKLTTYRNVRAALNVAIADRSKLLDVGNGGVFDYDTSRVDEVVGVDLFLGDATASPDVPANVTLRYGDALDLPEPDSAYDGVLLSSVLHHLISTDVEGTVANVRRAIGEAHRVLQPGGKLIVMESCVPGWFYAFERRLFGALRLVASTRLMKHPATLQLTPAAIEQILRERFPEVVVRRIPVGALILQFGYRWPTLLTPARPYLFIAE
jgi:ubiquinone/menaquinone biosynthesis C-methylase UbiE